LKNGNSGSKSCIQQSSDEESESEIEASEQRRIARQAKIVANEAIKKRDGSKKAKKI
jgi:hypothetical protein